MPSAPRTVHRPLVIKAANISRVHTYLAYTAFLTALFLGCLFHYKKIVKNGIAGYPEEWFPSVSATIGDWYPERNVFQILIALNSGPRFALVCLQYYQQYSTSSALPLVVFITGLVRTVSCGGWVYITSSDDHDAHDVLMLTYIICNIPWMFGGIACTSPEYTQSLRKRKIYAGVFFGSILPMIYFFIQHKVYEVPGAYTHYAFFEWTLIFTDIGYDAVTELDFSETNLQLTVGFPGESLQSIPIKDVVSGAGQKAKADIGAPEKPSTTKTSISEKTQPPTEVQKLPGSHRLKTVISNYREAISFTADIYLSYIFWSVFTSLIPTLFYFSVWELGIAGAELALLSILSPGLLGITHFKHWASDRSGRVTLHILSFFGLAAYKLPTPFQRLIVVTIATFFLCIVTVVDWSGLSGSSVTYQSILIGLGLILSSISKSANHGNNPVWPMLDESTGGYNKTGLLLAGLAVYEVATRPSPLVEGKEHKPTVNQPDDKTVDNGAISSWLPKSLALGSLVFSLHLFLTDASTLIAWTWTGYPIKGPVPHLHSAYTILAQVSGLLIPFILPYGSTVTTSPLWFAFGSATSYILYAYDDWIGYFGGLGVAVFLMSIIPQTVQAISETKHIGRTYFTAFIVTVLLYLANVWTVAYAFVPGGVYLRERTDLVFLVQVLCLVSVFRWPGTSRNSNPVAIRLPTSVLSRACGALVCMLALTAAVTVYHTPVDTPRPHRPGQRILRAGIWTVHFGMNNEGRDSQRGMRDLIKDMELDIVGLLETDLHRPVYGNRDLTRVLIEDLGYFVDIGPGPDKHTWGAVLLSKFPIINSTHHLLPSPDGELAPAISAYLDVWGTEVMVIVAHNGQEETPLDRELQATELARIMNFTYPNPVIFLGYVVTKPHALRPAPYQIMVEDGRVHDIDAQDYDRWCEYIFYRGLYRTSYLRMSRGKITDTEMQAGQFVVPPFGHGVVDDSESARYLRRHKEALPAEHWFPLEYYGNEYKGGKNGHYYHVFGTPLYYGIPDGAGL